MKILFLPLDSRPITFDVPYLIGRSAGFDVFRPNKDTMDFYKIPSNYDEIKKWLLENVKDCDNAIISVDQLVYGNLLESRAFNISLDEAIERLKLIKDLKKINPDINIFLTNTLMRSTISTLSSEDVKWWKKVNEYSINCDNPQRQEEIAKEIPENILNRFINSRNRNHIINLLCIDLLNEKYCNELIVLQEDSSSFGIHKKEQDILLNKVKEYDLSDKFHMMNGTDEIASLLMGKLNNENGSSAYIDWSYDNYEELICCFEDRPFVQNVNEYLSLANVNSTSIDKADYIICIYFPRNLKQGDYCSKFIAKNTKEEINIYANHIKNYIDDDRKVCLLDIYNANGGSVDLIEKLNEMNILSKIYVYSGWNTASNSLGTLIGEMLINKKDELLFERHILDDVIYQSNIRKEIEKDLLEKNEDPWNVINVNRTSSLINQKIHERQKDLSLNISKIYEAKLIWPRIFECFIEFKED